MSYLKLLGLWNQIKRQLRSLIIKVGMKKDVDWKDELDRGIDILEDIADVRDSVPESTTDSPYDNLIPKDKKRRR